MTPIRKIDEPSRATCMLLAGLALALIAGPTEIAALEIDTHVENLRLRFDNTFRYNLGVRTGAVDKKIGANPAFTDGEHSVPQGGITTNRMDLLSELDLSYADRYGVRVSGAGWYDHAYDSGTASGSPTLAAAGIPGSYVGNDLSSYTRDRYRGPYGELLDAFAFARFELLDVLLSLRAGRHTVFWGESLQLAGAIHGVSYSQMPLDLQKGFATPGIEAKELFRPLAGVSAQAQVTPSLSIAGQYFLEWQSYLFPEGGTFLGPADFAFNGPDGVYFRSGAANLFLKNGGVSKPRGWGDWGVALRYGPQWLDGTVGLFYRRFTDQLPAVLLTENPGGVGPLSPTMNSPFQYRQYYGEGIDLFGASFSKQLLGVSVAAEASYRHDMPLLSQTLGFAAAPAAPLAPVLFPHGVPTLNGNTYQARGDTLHGVLNAIGVVPGSLLFDTASAAIELTYSRWLRVGANEDMFYGLGHGVCRTDPTLVASGRARGRADGCATRDQYAVGAAFTPTWFRVLDGVDLTLPLSASWNFLGNSPVTLGGNEHSGTYSVGVGADIRTRYRVDLRYVGFYGSTYDNGTTLTSQNGLLALLKSRQSVTLTAKTTF